MMINSKSGMSVGPEMPPAPTASASTMKHLTRVAPGLPALLRYRFAEDFRHDLVAGISVAAVALPVAVAYAQLAGFNPVVGLYSSILPLVAYAIFGTSRQLMVNPDAATCAMIAAAIAPLAADDGESISVAVNCADVFHRRLVHCGEFFPPRCIGGFPVQTNPDWLPKRYRNQHFSWTNWQAVWIFNKVARHRSSAARNLRQAPANSLSNAWGGSG